MIIREAAEGDFEQMVPLLAELLRHPEEEISAMGDLFIKGLQSDKRAMFVAERDGKIEGLVTLTVYKKEAFWADCIKAEIDEVIIASSARGTGTAGLLMERALKHTEDRGCEYVELWSRLDKERAPAFYQKYGLMKTGFFLQKKM